MKMFVKYKHVWNEMILQLCKAKVAFLGNQNSRNPKNVFEGCEILETTQEFTLSQGDTILLNSLVRPLVSNYIYAKKDRNGLPRRQVQQEVYTAFYQVRETCCKIGIPVSGNYIGR